MKSPFRIALPLLLGGIALACASPTKSIHDVSPPPELAACDGAVPDPKAGRAIHILVIDRSGSTREASGSDVDGDGLTGVDPHREPTGPLPNRDIRSTDPGDTVLAAEVAAALAWLDEKTGPRDEIGVLAFSGPMNPTTGYAIVGAPITETVVPPSTDRSAAIAALESMPAGIDRGGTNYAAAIDAAVALVREARERAPGTPAAIGFFTDGLPTLPVGTGAVADPGDFRLAYEAARTAGTACIPIHTMTFGPGAEDVEGAGNAMAILSGGSARTGFRSRVGGE